MDTNEFKKELFKLLEDKKGTESPADILRSFLADRVADMIMVDRDYDIVMNLLTGDILPYYPKDLDLEGIFNILIEELDPDDILEDEVTRVFEDELKYIKEFIEDNY